VVATCTTFLEVLFFLSWFHHRGSPHGMTPTAGFWSFIRKFVVYVSAASIFLSVLSKGKCRLLLFAWAASLAFVVYAILMIEFD
jgi:small-conductance mechanosensitive channel